MSYEQQVKQMLGQALANQEEVVNKLSDEHYAALVDHINVIRILGNARISEEQVIEQVAALSLVPIDSIRHISNLICTGNNYYQSGGLVKDETITNPIVPGEFIRIVEGRDATRVEDVNNVYGFVVGETDTDLEVQMVYRQLADDIKLYETDINTVLIPKSAKNIHNATWYIDNIHPVRDPHAKLYSTVRGDLPQSRDVSRDLPPIESVPDEVITVVDNLAEILIRETFTNPLFVVEPTQAAAVGKKYWDYISHDGGLASRVGQFSATMGHNGKKFEFKFAYHYVPELGLPPAPVILSIQDTDGNYYLPEVSLKFNHAAMLNGEVKLVEGSRNEIKRPEEKKSGFFGRLFGK